MFTCMILYMADDFFLLSRTGIINYHQIQSCNIWSCKCLLIRGQVSTGHYRYGIFIGRNLSYIWGNAQSVSVISYRKKKDNKLFKFLRHTLKKQSDTFNTGCLRNLFVFKKKRLWRKQKPNGNYKKSDIKQKQKKTIKLK